MISTPFRFSLLMFDICSIYDNYDRERVRLHGPPGGKADKLKLPPFRKSLQFSKFGLITSSQAKSFNVTMFEPNYNCNARASSKPTVAFILIKVMLNIDIFQDQSKFDACKRN